MSVKDQVAEWALQQEAPFRASDAAIAVEANITNVRQALQVLKKAGVVHSVDTNGKHVKEGIGLFLPVEGAIYAPKVKEEPQEPAEASAEAAEAPESEAPVAKVRKPRQKRQKADPVEQALASLKEAMAAKVAELKKVDGVIEDLENRILELKQTSIVLSEEADKIQKAYVAITEG